MTVYDDELLTTERARSVEQEKQEPGQSPQLACLVGHGATYGSVTGCGGRWEITDTSHRQVKGRRVLYRCE